jgi:phage terminase large subunit-like protein
MLDTSLPIDELLELDPTELDEIIMTMPANAAEALLYDWQMWARGNQLIPSGEWFVWLLLAGRGFGKTRTGAETVRVWSKQHTYVNLIAPTADDARDVMVEGESGILSVCPAHERPHYQPSKRRLVWPNGAISQIFTADEPERLRGKQHMKLWADELCAWRYPEAWDMAMLGLRLGPNPQALVTTTPKPIRLIKELLADERTFVTRGKTQENKRNLAPKFLEQIIKKYEGTRLGRQELDGEVLDDNPGALFKRANIDEYRVKKMPCEMRRIVIGLDPFVSNDPKSDEAGIVAVCEGDDGHAYVLHDFSLNGITEDWGATTVRQYHALAADCVVAEVNNGGDLVINTMRVLDPNINAKKVTASRGKAVRAEPVAALYEQGRVHHVGCLPTLEDQMCDWNPADKTAKSPDRMDALVWALTELMVQPQNDGLLRALEAQVAAKRAEQAKRAN